MSSKLENRKSLEVSLVSVVIPCYNHAHFLSEAIESVMAQTWQQFEVIVVDDGSLDNTREVALRYSGVRYIRQTNQGLSASRNTGLGHSSGNFLVFLDADDRLRPAALESGLRLLKMHPQCAFVAGRCQHIAADGSCLPSFSLSYRNCKDHYGALLKTNFILNPASVMYRRTVFESVGVFDASVNAAADYDVYLRIAQQYPIYCHDEVVVEYRQHSANMSSKLGLMFKTILAVLRSQRGYVKAHLEFKPDYDKGMQMWRSRIGPRLTEEVIEQFLMRRVSKRLLDDLLVLLRYYPQGFAAIGARAYRKIGRKVYRKIFSGLANIR